MVSPRVRSEDHQEVGKGEIRRIQAAGLLVVSIRQGQRNKQGVTGKVQPTGRYAKHKVRGRAEACQGKLEPYDQGLGMSSI